MSHNPDIAIIGGGIIGLTSAYLLAREGRRVIVLDKGDMGQESSWAGAGIIPGCDLAAAKTPLDELRAHSVRLFPELSRELRERTAIDNGYRRSGGLEFLDLDEATHPEEWHSESGEFRPLSAVDLARLEPRLAPELGRALHLADMAQVRNPRHLRALQAACQSLGVELRPHCAAQSFAREGPRITALQTSDGPVCADTYLLTTGAWTDGILAHLGRHAAIRPIRGQIVLLFAPSVPLKHILLWGARYVVPRGDGHILIGSTEEDVGFKKGNTAVAVQELLALACRLVPDLSQATVVRCWSGLRPGSADGLPFIGPVTGWANLFVAAGHYRAGIQLSAGTALVVKEMLLGRVTTVPLAAFGLTRIKS